MKKLLGKILTLTLASVIVCCLALNGVSCKRSEKEAKEKEVETAKRLQRERLIQELVTKHNAVTDWHEKLAKEHEIIARHSLFTVQVEDALIRTDARPVMFVAQIEDVVRVGDTYSVHFSVSRVLGLLFSNPYYHFVLRCTQDQVDYILQNHKGYSVPFSEADFAVIAQISDVGKVNIQFAPPADCDNSSEHGDFDVYISHRIGPSNIFSASGQCIDLLFVGD